MVLTNLSRRYAKGLFEIVQKKNYSLELTLKQLKLISTNIDSQVMKIIEHPGISSEEKQKLLQNIVGENIYKELQNFLYFLMSKKRLKIFQEIVGSFENIMNEFNDVLRVDIKSAYELSADKRKLLEDKISELKSKKIVADYNVDIDLIAGIVIKVGDQIYDNSIKSQLQKLNSVISGK